MELGLFKVNSLKSVPKTLFKIAGGIKVILIGDIPSLPFSLRLNAYFFETFYIDLKIRKVEKRFKELV